MPLPPRLDDALGRLHAALHRLQVAAERRALADAGRAEGDREFFLLQDNRDRLAGELDAVLARNAHLLAAQETVSARLDRVGRTVEGVLQGLVAAEGAR